MNCEKNFAQRREVSMLMKALSYVIPSVGMGLILSPVVMILGGIYAKHFGLALTTIASVILLARIFDAISDPIIGYYSDRWRSRSGSRKSFMLVGAILLVPCSYFLFVPIGEVTTAYFTFWYLAFYFSLTVFSIPYVTWINEFATDTREKTLVFSMNAIATQGGGALFYLIPLLPFFPGSEITPQILQVTVIISAVILLSGLIIAFQVVPDGSGSGSVPENANIPSTMTQLGVVIQSMINNKPFILFVLASTFLGIGTGMWFGMFFIYVDSYLHLGDEFSKASLWGMVIGVLSVPIWYRTTLMMGKRKAWLIGMILMTFSFFCTSLLSPEGTGIYELFALNMLMVFGVGSIGVIAGPMLCDVIDFGRLKDHIECNATYFSIFALLNKLQGAVGGALGMGIAGWFGFDVLTSEQTASGLLGLHIAVAWLPALFIGMAMIFIAFMPLSEERMVVIRKRLAARDRSLAEMVNTA